jgi:hypothetical protein
MTKPRLVLPSEIPWGELRGEALEEMVYWLCDAIGAVDLVWRAGSISGTSRDRGRDVEATFHVEEPGGDFRPERWWLQAKGRSKTLEPSAVKEVANDAQGASDLDVLVIATNSRFSNDTRDWVSEFQALHPRPVIKLWDRSQLERMAIAHPAVVARIAPQALSPQGRLEAASTAFWNRGQWPETNELDAFWAQRSELEFSPDALLACVVGEGSNGRLATHPWGGELDLDSLALVLVSGLANSGALLLRFQAMGRETGGLADGLAHLLACSLVRFSDKTVLNFILDPWSYTHGPEDGSREQLRKLLIEPVMQRLLNYFGAACVEDCVRVVADFEEREEGDLQNRWLSMLPARFAESIEEKDQRLLMIEDQDKPCNAGLTLSAERGCPFVAGAEHPWEKLIPELQTVVRNRVADRVKTLGIADDEEGADADEPAISTFDTHVDVDETQENS